MRKGIDSKLTIDLRFSYAMVVFGVLSIWIFGYHIALVENSIIDSVNVLRTAFLAESIFILGSVFIVVIGEWYVEAAKAMITLGSDIIAVENKKIAKKAGLQPPSARTDSTTRSVSG